MNKKGCDPGWNDPPLFSYDSQIVTKPRTMLNKRVAFPLHEAAPPSASPQVSLSRPPPPLHTTTPPIHQPPPTPSPVTPDQTFDSQLALDTVTNNFNYLLEEKYKVEDKARSEIQRRLDCMRQMWTDDKLCTAVQLKLLSLSKALRDDDVNKADELQKGLMVDHSSVCSPWISGVRRLVHHQTDLHGTPE